MVNSVRVALCIAVVMFGLHALAGVYAASTNGWNQAKSNVTGTTRIAPFFLCPGNAGSETITCSDYKAFEIVDGSCKVTEDENMEYMRLVRAFVITPGALSAVGGAVALVGLSLGTFKVAIRIVPALVFAALALVTNAAGIAITITSFKSIMCDKGPCRGASGCEESWEGSALLYFCSMVFPLIAVSILVVVLVQKVVLTPSTKPAHGYRNQNPAHQRQPTPRDFYPQHPANAMQQQQASTAPRDIRSPGKEEPYAASPGDYSVVEQKAAGDGPVHPEGFELPEGDWAWDPASNMYWSETQYLFLNPQNSHFYDPNSNHWYNAETEAWYPAE